jgi:pimeloyl-ACP methyl ester carboxylesterase
MRRGPARARNERLRPRSRSGSTIAEYGWRVTGERIPSVQIDGLRVAYRRAGDGPPLILLHGILSDSRAWDRQLAELSREFSVVAWDAPGAGQSSDPPASFGAADYADCLSAFMEALELRRSHVLGLSWGGVLAQELYRRHPDRIGSLVLADTYAGWRGSLPEEACAERLRSCLRESELPASEFVPGWLPGLLSDNAPQELRDEVTAVMSDFHPVGYRQMALALAETDTRDLLSDIRVPTLLLWGEADQRSPLSVAEQLRDGIPGATLVLIGDAGHESNLEQPARFNAAVREFCRSVSNQP